MLYKIYDECYLKQHTCRYIFRVPYKSDIGYQMLLKDYKTDKAELIIERNPLKFEDVLITKYKYQTLNGSN